jgi:hypothetical protein
MLPAETTEMSKGLLHLFPAKAEIERRNGFEKPNSLFTETYIGFAIGFVKMCQK